ncbi:MAG: hypothetical protein PHO41_11190 [Eubacteriales bacterium]|nr:hypothetical protein [Eubacteriales bacterium]
MLVADIADAQLHRVLRGREGLRVFAALDENGNIAPEMIQKACTAVAKMADTARENGAQELHLFATSAVRDAANQQQFAQSLQEVTGLTLEICTGEVEARLSFLGATGTARSGMLDIGGGSTEIVIGQGEKLEFADSLQMGAVRLYRMAPITTIQQAYQVMKIASGILKPHKQAILALPKPAEWYGVGGTFTTTAALTQNVHWEDRRYIHGFSATRAQILRVMEQLAPLSLQERMALPGLQPQRADIIVHDIAILACCMEELEIEAITVSEYGNLEGYLKWRYLQQG